MKKSLLFILMLFVTIPFTNAQQSRFNEAKTKEAVLQFQREQKQGLHASLEETVSIQALRSGINNPKLNAPALANVKLYGYRVYSDDSQPQGFISFNSSNPTVVTYENGYTVSPNNAGAGEYHDHNLYLNTYFSGIPQNFIQLTDTWAQVSSVSSSLHLIDMAYDYSTDKMYGIAGAPSTSLYMVDLTTGAVTLVGVTVKQLFTLACDLNGNLYGVSSTSGFCSINKVTGVATEIGPTGISVPYYLQSMAFDHNSGRLFWALCNNTDGKLIEIDPATGIGTDLGQIGQNSEVVMLYTPYLISSPTTIVTQPIDGIVCEGNNHLFTVEASGTNLNYQWQKQSGNSWEEAPKASYSSSYTISGATLSDAGKYRVLVSGKDGQTLTSSVVELKVNSPAAIVSQPLDASICQGSNYTISCQATGSSLSYQWYINNKPIPGATNAGYTILNATKVKDYDNYKVSIQGICGSGVISREARIWVADSIRQPLLLSVPGVAYKGQSTRLHVGYEYGYPDVTRYTWSLGDPNSDLNPILPNAQTAYVNFHTTTANQVVRINLEHVCGTYTDSVTIKVEVSTGINNTEVSGLSIYPNPVSDKFIISTENTENEIQSVDIFDTNGKLIYQQTTINNQALFPVNSSGWVKGTYLVKVTTIAGIKVFKVVKD